MYGLCRRGRGRFGWNGQVEPRENQDGLEKDRSQEEFGPKVKKGRLGQYEAYGPAKWIGQVYGQWNQMGQGN